MDNDLVEWIVDKIVKYMEQYNNEHVTPCTEQIYSKIEVLCDILVHMGVNTAWDYKDGIFHKFYITIPYEVICESEVSRNDL